MRVFMAAGAAALMTIFQPMPALAQDTAGDPARGRQLFETCLGCHGVAGYYNVYPTFKVPKLAGQNAAYIVTALKAYKSGARKHETMRANAANLSEQDMRDIGAYLEQAGS